MACRLGLALSTLCVLLVSALTPSVALGDSSDGWSLSITSVSTVEELHTVQHTTGYDGTVEEIHYDDIPSTGMCYAIVSTRLSKVDPTADALSANEIELIVDGVSYEAIEPVSTFLNNHNFETFPGEQVISSATGAIAFEVPKSLLGVDGSGWIVQWSGSSSAPFNPFNNEVPSGKNYVNAQKAIEQNLTDYYNGSGGATLDEPMIVKDVYGVAPLTAVALFETDSAQSITVTVHGKDSSGDITYPVHGASIYHEVPIFGLYAGYENVVTLQAGDASVDIVIETQPLPESVEYVNKVGGYGIQQLGQLFVLQSPHQIVFDNNGDIRWYLSESWSTKTLESDSSYPMCLDGDSAGFYFVRNPMTGSVYNSGDELVHMTWMGKIEQIVSNPAVTPDHDLTLVDDDTVLYIQEGMSSQNAAIWQLDLNTGEAQPWLKMTDILDESIAPSYADAWDDVWHINSIQYLQEDGSLLISLRNQSMVIKVDANSREVEWAFTPASGYNADGSTWARQEAVSDCVVLPTAEDGLFEWFYDQHHVNAISYDPEKGIMDIVLFDNGTYRYNFGDVANDEQYSRVCRYRIDENTRTATLVYQYGKDRGSDLYSWWYGSSQYLSQVDHYVGTFAVFKGAGSSHIVESDAQGNAVAEYQVERAENGAYRATVFNVSGGFDEMGFAEREAAEVHWWSPGYWRSSSTEALGDASLCTISSIFRDGNTLNVVGSACVSLDNYASAVELVADGDSGVFAFKVATAGAGGLFYGKGVGLDSLPDGSYALSVRATADNQTVDIPLGYTISIGDAIDANVSVSENLPDGQQQILMEAMAMQAAASSFSEMVVTQDPFGITPLTAMAQFHTEDLSSVSVRVHGKTERTDVWYNVEGERLLHLVPIVGLYYNDTSLVTVSLTHQDGSVESKDIELTTGAAPNPSKMPDITVTYDRDRESEIAPGLTFCAPSGGSYYYAVDLEGDIRWYYAFSGNVGIDGVSFNDDGHLLLLDGSKSSSAETNNFCAVEIDLLGREYRSYYLPYMSFHHELKQLSSGNYLALATDYTKSTVNDVIVEFDPGTGAIERRWDTDEILGRYGIHRMATPSYELPILTDDGGDYNENWFHANSVLYLEGEDCLIVSSRHQSAVFKIDCKTGSVIWVLSDPECYAGTNLEDLLLRVVDSDACSADRFQWQYGQHAAMVCSDGDIALFDNGNYRTKLAENRVMAPDNYSRVMKLHIDDAAKTVALSWEWGRDLGSDDYCALIGDIDELGDAHYLATFGGHCLTGPDGAVSDSSASYIESTLYELSGNDVVWQLSSKPTSPIRSSAIYRAERLELTSLPYSYDALNGSMWTGDAGEVLGSGFDPSSYTRDLDGVRVASVLNEGNRITVSGSVIDAPEISALYVGQDAGGTFYALPVEVGSNGSFAAVFTYSPSQCTSTRSFCLMADMADGSKCRAQLDIEISGLTTSAASIAGDCAMELGDRKRMILTLSPSGVTDERAEWSSSNPDVIEIDGSGNALAKKPGFAVVTARSSDNGTCSQVVVTVAGAVLDSSDLSIRRGDDIALSIISVDGNTLADSATWHSADNNVVTVDEQGVVHGVDKGETTVWADFGGRRLECQVVVSVGLEDGVYTIGSKLRRNLVVDVAGASASNGANVQLWTDNNSFAQQFKVSYQGNGQYQISALCSDKMLDVQGGGVVNGTNVWQYESNGTASQYWCIEECEDGWFTLTSAQNGLVLDVSGGATYDGANVQVWESNDTDAQKFSFNKRFQEGIYRIGMAEKPSLVLDVEGASIQSGANVQLYAWNRSAAQMFLVTYASEGAYTIIPLCSGNVLDLSAASPYDGANVQQYARNDTAAQRWFIQENADGSFAIISASSGKYLDVANGELAAGANVQTWQGNSTDAQRFDFVPLSTLKTIVSGLDSSLVLDICGGSTESGANVQLYKRNGTKAQMFHVSDLTSEGKRFIIPALGAHMSLDAVSGGYQDGANVWQYQINGSLAQQWYVQSVGDGRSRITVASSGRVLDVPSADAYSGANVQVYSWNGTEAQKFVLE